ncbi:unnamed protein product [Haemonchus placei]|uniref:Uncharacterized protein n=1 Tax=Haemonchus placei TaxID=6290 RepID=A0A0N4WI50_HAEPC|nr:unnamed protein product [Haemonchus placei]
MIIERSTSERASPVVLVRKTVRSMCSYCTTPTQKLIRCCKAYKVDDLPQLDMDSSYWQILLSTAAKEAGALTTLTTLHAAFHRFMDTLFHGLKNKEVFIYVHRGYPYCHDFRIETL